MLKWYKNYKKQYYENKIQECIDYNIDRIDLYINNTPKKHISTIDTMTPVCKGYCDNMWEHLRKYNINKSLYNKMMETIHIAEIEYNNMEHRIDVQQQHIEDNKKVELYKQAILQLQQEGKITL